MEIHVAPWPVLAVVGMFVGVIFWWFYLIREFFTYMSKNHPAKYQELGSPTLILNNTIRNNIAFLGFILGNKYKTLQDEHLSKKCGFLKNFFYAYLAVLLSLFVGLQLIALYR